MLLFWKARLADPEFLDYKSTRVRKNRSKAIALYKLAVDLNIEGMAEAGDRYACACIGWMYRHGRGVDENRSTAVKWYRKAAEQGHTYAQDKIGVMYENG